MFQDRPGRVHAPWDNVPALVATMVGRHLAHPEKRIEGEQARNLIEAKAHDAEKQESPTMDSVGLTSRWVAAARARESERLDRLFDDPLAAALAGSEGFAWLDHMERAQPWGQPALYVVVRTRFFDDFQLRASWATGARQVVLLAAGMDARAFRLDWPPGTRL